MSSAVFLFLSVLRLNSLQGHYNITNNEKYYEFPHFWTNIGFCPQGALTQHQLYKTLSSPELRLNFAHISALPSGAVTHVRIHWLLDLIKFKQYTPSGVPMYDFDDLDDVIYFLDKSGLNLVIEFMGNPGNVFLKNPNRNDFYWQNFAYQFVHYFKELSYKVENWRFESWNEPDLVNYNKLNFTVEDYFIYVNALKRGLNEVTHNFNSHFPLRGPAGLFKSQSKHPLCWKILEQCNKDIKACPFDVLTYHRKGNGSASEVLHLSSELLKDIYTKFPNLKNLPISNSEADPVSIWSNPHEYLSDVHYAATLVTIVLDHWSAKLEGNEFKNLETISHDNAFLSYHPYEFSQRTLLAHFRMNNSNPQYSVFIQKPVYAALGMLSKLASYAANLEQIWLPTGSEVRILKTINGDNVPLYLSWIMVSEKNSTYLENSVFQRDLPFQLCKDETFAFILEILEQNLTNPSLTWRQYGSPAYPNTTVFEELRRRQSVLLHSTGFLHKNKIDFNIGNLEAPWIALLRVCSNLMPPLKQPQSLFVSRITKAEILLTWRESGDSANCLKTYEISYRTNETLDWSTISEGWHVPTPSFHYSPKNGITEGWYRVRGIDIFNRTSKYLTSNYAGISDT